MLPVRDPSVRDFLITIGVSGAFAFWYFFAYFQPDRSRVTRAVNKYAGFWGRFRFSLPARPGILVVALVCAAIFAGAVTLFVFRIASGRLP